MQKSNVLAGQTAVVTGAGRGIGASIALHLAELGAAVVLCGRTAKPLEETAARIAKSGGQAEAATCDVGNFESVSGLAQKFEKRTLNILINNAGVGDFSGPLHELPPETWDRILRTNLTGIYHMIHQFAPIMIRSGGGHIVNISSLASKNALPNGAAYAASKWGLNGLTVSVAEELRSKNIRVSVVCPGSVHTDFSPHTGKDSKKMLQPDDIAHVIGMLVTQSPQSFVSEVLLRPTMKP